MIHKAWLSFLKDIVHGFVEVVEPEGEAFVEDVAGFDVVAAHEGVGAQLAPPEIEEGFWRGVGMGLTDEAAGEPSKLILLVHRRGCEIVDAVVAAFMIDQEGDDARPVLMVDPREWLLTGTIDPGKTGFDRLGDLVKDMAADAEHIGGAQDDDAFKDVFHGMALGLDVDEHLGIVVFAGWTVFIKDVGWPCGAHAIISGGRCDEQEFWPLVLRQAFHPLAEVAQRTHAGLDDLFSEGLGPALDADWHPG